MSGTGPEALDSRSDLPPHITRTIRPDTPVWTSTNERNGLVRLHIGTAYRIRIDIHRAAVDRLITLLSAGLFALDGPEKTPDTATVWPVESTSAGGDKPSA